MRQAEKRRAAAQSSHSGQLEEARGREASLQALSTSLDDIFERFRRAEAKHPRVRLEETGKREKE